MKRDVAGEDANPISEEEIIDDASLKYLSWNKELKGANLLKSISLLNYC